MNKAETLKAIDEIKQTLFDIHEKFPKQARIIIRITDIDVKVFHEVCAELKAEIEHPCPTKGENRLIAYYQCLYGDIVLKSEPVTMTVEYISDKEK